MISHQDACALIETPSAGLDELLARAGEMRDRGTRAHRHVLGEGLRAAHDALPRLLRLLHLPPRSGRARRPIRWSPTRSVALAQAGGRLGAKEALFSLGDRPEALFASHREFLKRHGHRTTLSYLRAVCAAVLADSPLLPHANPGVMGERDLAALREVNVSMGIMLETVSERLLGRGLAHDRAPDKVPARRLRTIALAGKLGIPFTTGLLNGHRRDATRARRHAGRDPRPPREGTATSGGHRPELPGPSRASRCTTRRSPSPRGSPVDPGGGALDPRPRT
jgi:hypothetical protein